MKAEKDLPEEERRFLTLDNNRSFFTKEAFYWDFVVPVGIYLTWAFLYYLINFVFRVKNI